MKSTTVALAILCIISVLNSCKPSSVGQTQKGYFGEGGSSQDTLFLRALDSPVAFIVERNYKGEGGSSQDTLYFKPNEYARFYKMKDPRKK